MFWVSRETDNAEKNNQKYPDRMRASKVLFVLGLGQQALIEKYLRRQVSMPFFAPMCWSM
jgi:hypothetical protein